MNLYMIYQSPQEFLDAYRQWRDTFDWCRLDREGCDGNLHGFLLCCPKHIDLLVERNTFHSWAKFYDMTYDLRTGYEQEDKEWGYPDLLSDSWLCRFAKVSRSTL